VKQHDFHGGEEHALGRLLVAEDPAAMPPLACSGGARGQSRAAVAVCRIPLSCGACRRDSSRCARNVLSYPRGSRVAKNRA
jgi:hypothetical protein